MKIKGKILFYAVASTAILGALLSVLQLWFSFLQSDDFLKCLITLAISGALLSFLIAVDYDTPAMRSKLLFALLVALAFSGAGLIIIQMWWTIFSWPFFYKILASMAILAGLSSFLMVAGEDLGQNKTLRDDKYID